jgi:proliferating cell nuclear antigen
MTNDDKTVRAVFRDGATFKRTIEALRELTPHVVLDFEESCQLGVQATDVSNVCLVILRMPFNDGCVPEPLSVGVDLGSLLRILKLLSSDGGVELRAEPGAAVLSVALTSDRSDKSSRFELPLMELDEARFSIPDGLSYDARVTMASPEYARIFKDLASLGGEVTMECMENSFDLIVRGDLGRATVSYNTCRECDVGLKEDAGGLVAMESHREVKMSFSLKYMNTFAKACSLAPVVRLFMSSGQPLSVRVSFADGVGHDSQNESHDSREGVMQFFLAPRMDDDDDDGDENEGDADADGEA